MRRAILAATLLLTLASGTALANPGVRVEYLNGGIQVLLDGAYPGATYRVYRADGAGGAYTALMSTSALCTGDCLVQDVNTAPGQDYRYRFDLTLADGSFVSYGPYLVSIPNHAFRATISPNPGRGPAQVELSVPGGARDLGVAADARILDLQGRSIRVLLHGPLARGVTTVRWDGRAEGGRSVGAGVYFLSFSSTLGRSISRIVRVE